MLMQKSVFSVHGRAAVIATVAAVAPPRPLLLPVLSGPALRSPSGPGYYGYGGPVYYGADPYYYGGGPYYYGGYGYGGVPYYRGNPLASW